MKSEEEGERDTEKGSRRRGGWKIPPFPPIAAELWFCPVVFLALAHDIYIYIHTYTLLLFFPSLPQCLVVGTSHQTMGPSSPRVTQRSTPAQLTAPGWSPWLLASASNWTSPCFRFMGHTTSSLCGKKWLRLQIHWKSFYEILCIFCTLQFQIMFCFLWVNLNFNVNLFSSETKISRLTQQNVELCTLCS